MIEFIYNTTHSLSNQKTITSWLLFVAKSEGLVLEKMLYNFVTPQRIREINKKHLNHDYATDIITFDYSENDIVSAEAFICQDQVIENAKNYKQSADNEMLRVLCHAVLHLAGHRDKTKHEVAQMRKKEDHYLGLYNTTFK